MFVHLHLHSDRTIGRSIIKASQLVDKQMKIGGSAACITDSMTMSACVQLYNACKKRSIKPIFGMEVHIVPERMKKEQKYTTLVLLAKNYVGFKNLVKIATTGSMFFYYSPRVDLEIIKKYSEGIICLSGDTRGYPASQFFLRGRESLSEINKEMLAIFAEFYWEVQPVQSDSQKIFNEAVFSSAENGGVKIVTTSDPHYIEKEDYEFFERYQAARNSKNSYYQYPHRCEKHVMSDEEMHRAFVSLHGDAYFAESDLLLEAIHRSNEIADSIESFDLKHGVKIPSFEE